MFSKESSYIVLLSLGMFFSITKNKVDTNHMCVTKCINRKNPMGYVQDNYQFMIGNVINCIHNFFFKIIVANRITGVTNINMWKFI